MTSPSSDDKLNFQVVTFEQYMLADHSPEFPMSFAFEFRLDQPIDLDRLKASADATLPWHPLLSSLLSADSQYWQFTTPDAQLIKDQHPAESLVFDLKTQTGLKIFQWSGSGNETNIAMLFHHACCDGLGSWRFVRDVAEVYTSGNTKALESRWSPADAAEHLRSHRKSYGRNRFWHFVRWPLDLLGMLWTYEVVFGRPRSLNSPDKESIESKSRASSIAECVSIQFTPAETKTVKSISKRNGQTLNDRLIELSFLALDTALEESDPEANPLIRVIVPMNLRARSPKTAANMVAMVNLDRRVRKRRVSGASNGLRKGLRWETALIKRIDAGVTANRFLQMQKAIFGSWQMSSKTKRCLATCPVSNLGFLGGAFTNHHDGRNEPLRFGEVNVDSVRLFCAVLRSNTNLIAAAFSYRGALTIDLTFNPSELAPSDVEQLANRLRLSLLNEEDG